jgi:Domain of unknown function (DUF1883)
MSGQFVKYDLGHLNGGELVTVTIRERANVRLFDSSNLRLYERGQRFHFTGESGPPFARAAPSPKRRQLACRARSRRRERNDPCKRHGLDMSLGAVMTLQQETQLVAYLRAHPRLQPYVQLASVGAWPRSYAGLPSAEQFARELLGDAEFRARKLGTWLGTPDGEAVSEAVAQVIPADCQWPSVSPHWWPLNSPLVAIVSPRWWPSNVPTRGHRFSPTGGWVRFR